LKGRWRGGKENQGKARVKGKRERAAESKGVARRESREQRKGGEKNEIIKFQTNFEEGAALEDWIEGRGD